MRTSNNEQLKELAQNVFRWIFESGEPPAHILLRYYARGVVEVALSRGIDIQGDVNKICPPYRSEWPPILIRDAKELRNWSDQENGRANKSTLYSSIMSDLGDFASYVIGDMRDWSSERLDEPHQLTHEEICDEFIESLAERQKAAWNQYLFASDPMAGGLWYDQLDLTDLDSHETTAVEANKAETAFIRTLGKNSKKHQTYCDVVKPHLEGSHTEDRDNRFDRELARRWVLSRVLDFGWTDERFGIFDAGVKGRSPVGRMENKPERIGKKYQWIAYHELLARLSDNFRMRVNRWSGFCEAYSGIWDLRVRRKIDPSNLLTKSPMNRNGGCTNAWWFPEEYSSWTRPVEELAWLKESSDLPKIDNLIQLTSSDKTEWLTLNGYYKWCQPKTLGDTRSQEKYRELWYLLTGYLVKKEDLATLQDWAQKQNWWGSWMPESHESHDLCLGEFFWSPAFETYEDPDSNRDGWTRGNFGKLPVDVLVTNAEYGRESGSDDCSIEGHISINLPCRYLAEGMKLQWRGTEGYWHNETGKLVAQDPSVHEQGPGAFLFRRDLLLEFLDSRGLAIFWALLGERRVMGGSNSDKDDLGHGIVNGSYILKGGALEGGMRMKFESPYDLA